MNQERKDELLVHLLVNVQAEAQATRDFITGFIEQDEQRNYHCKKHLLDYNIVQANYNVGDKIRLIQLIDNTKERTKSKYPKFASKFEKID